VQTKWFFDLEGDLRRLSGRPLPIGYDYAGNLS